MNRIFVLLFILLGFAEAHGNYSAAAGRVDITPELGGYLAGYGPDRVSTAVLDPLWAHVMVFRYDHASTAAEAATLTIITLDNIGLTRPDILTLKDRIAKQLPHTHLIVSSTHTHAGPDVVGLWGPSLWRSGKDEDYLLQVTTTVSELVQSLHAQLVPVHILVNDAEAPFEWVQNLSEPSLLDKTLTVIKVVDEAGQVIGTLTNFACHPTVLGPDNTGISADYLVGFYEVMRRSLPGEHLFLQGAIGGWVQPLQGDRSIELAQDIGRQLGRFSLALLDRATPVEAQPLVYRDAEIDLPLDNNGFLLLIGLGVLDRELFGGWLGIDAMRTSVAYFRLGNVSFVTYPGEPSPYYSLEARKSSATPYLMVLGLTQDAIGYILKPDYFAKPDRYPHADYLTSVSVGSSAGPLLLQAVKTLMVSADPQLEPH